MDKRLDGPGGVGAPQGSAHKEIAYGHTWWLGLVV